MSTNLCRCWRAWLAALGVLMSLMHGAHAQDKVVVLTTWFAQAEHGGLYQALATGLYKKHGLDVTIRMGGPQVNGIQLLAAGEADFAMNRDFAVLQAVERGLPIVTIAAPSQIDGQGIMAREDVQNLGSLQGKTILIASTAHLYWWPWLKRKYGYTDAQARPYTGSLQPFFSDPNVVQQAFATAEPYQAMHQGVKVKFFPFAAEDYPPYHGALITMRRTIEQRPDMVARFVRASVEGWKSFLEDPAPAGELIKKANPAMTDGELNYAVQRLREMKTVTGGDAAVHGIGIMTDERWKKTRDFMLQYGMIKPDTDWTRAYTTQFVKDLKIMP